MAFVTNNNVWMETPDVLAFQIFDDIYTPGNVYDNSTAYTDAYETVVSHVNPRSGNSENCYVIGNDKKSVRFLDQPGTLYYDRTILADYTRYSIHGLTVTAAYRRTEQRGSPLFVNGLGASARHVIYLKLSSSPVNGRTYTIHRTDGQFSDIQFTYHDKITRAGAIKTTLNGHRPADVNKLAHLAARIPEGPNCGVVDFSNYSLGAGSTFYLIDQTNTIVFTGTSTLRCAATSQIDQTIADLSNPLPISSIPSKGATTRVIFTKAHGLSVNDKLRFFGMSGTTELEIGGASGTNPLMTVTNVVDSATVDITGVTTSNALTTSLYSTALGGVLNTAYKATALNAAGTNVYGLDYSTFTTAGYYRVYIPGFGVSDEFVIDDAAHNLAAAKHHQGFYSLRLGCATPYSSYSRGIALLDGHGGLSNYHSNLVAQCATEISGGGVGSTLLPGTNNTSAAVGNMYPSGLGAYDSTVTRTVGSFTCTGLRTATQATGSRPGHQDAGDNDDILPDHIASVMLILEVMKCIAIDPITTVYGSIDGWNTAFAFPSQLSSAVLDATLFAGTDAMPPIWHEVAWYLEAYRTQQGTHPSALGVGAVPGGYGVGHFSSQNPNYPEPVDHYRGTDPTVIGNNAGTVGAFLYAPDHNSTMGYAAAAASFAYHAYKNGFTTLGDTYKQSAIDAYSWADDLLTNSTSRDTYYKTGLAIDTYMGWDAAHYSSAMSTLNTNCTRRKIDAACMLYQVFQVTGGNGAGQVPYGDYIDTVYNITPNCWGGIAYRNTPGRKSTPANYFSAHGKDGNTGTDTASLIDNTVTFNGNPTPNRSTELILRAHRLDLENAVAGTATSDYLKALQRQASFIQGGNLLGRSHIVGFGARSQFSMLHIDSEYGGELNPPTGLSPYGYGFALSGTFAFKTGVNCDATTNYISDNVTGTYESQGTPGSKKMWWPWRYAQPTLEFAPESRAANTFMSEFTFWQVTLPWLAQMLYLHGWNGNTATSLTVTNNGITLPAVTGVGLTRRRHTHEELESVLKEQRDNTFSRRRWEEMRQEALDAIEAAKKKKRLQKVARRAAEAVETIASSDNQSGALQLLDLTMALEDATRATRLKDIISSIRVAEAAIAGLTTNDDEIAIMLLA